MRKPCNAYCEPDKGVHFVFQFSRWPLETIRERQLFKIQSEQPGLPEGRGSCVNGRGKFVILAIDEAAEQGEEPTDDVYVYPNLIKVQLLDPAEFGN